MANVAIEISAVKICAVRCEYCPQDLLISASKATSFNNSRFDLDTFLSCIDNADLTGNRNIYWTGYSEPCLNSLFPEMVELADQRGFVQSISTTLVGHQRCIDFLCDSLIIKSIGLHLPDDKGMMEKGRLKVDKKYINNLRNLLDVKLSQRDIDPSIKVSTLTFGRDYHPDIKVVISDPKYIPLLSIAKPYVTIHSRAGSVPESSVLKIGFKKVQNSGIMFFKALFNSPLPFLPYHCAYRRLKQPVLLGSGYLNICCMDYGLRGIIGDLSKQKLSSIYHDWELNEGEDLGVVDYLLVANVSTINHFLFELF